MKLTEVLTQLQQPISPHLISQKTLKGNRIDYIAWFDLCDILDNRCGIGGWSWEIKDLIQIGNRLHLTGVLTIIGEERQLTMMATGTEDIDCSSYGDPSSNAEAMSLRRCCAKFGLGRDLWRKNKAKPSNTISKGNPTASNGNGQSPNDWYERGKNDALSGNEAKYPRVKPYMDAYNEFCKINFRVALEQHPHYEDFVPSR